MYYGCVPTYPIDVLANTKVKYFRTSRWGHEKKKLHGSVKNYEGTFDWIYSTQT